MTRPSIPTNAEIVKAINEICKASRDYRKHRPPRDSVYYDKHLHNRLEKAERALGSLFPNRPLIDDENTSLHVMYHDMVRVLNAHKPRDYTDEEHEQYREMLGP